MLVFGRVMRTLRFSHQVIETRDMVLLTCQCLSLCFPACRIFSIPSNRLHSVSVLANCSAHYTLHRRIQFRFDLPQSSLRSPTLVQIPMPIHPFLVLPETAIAIYLFGRIQEGWLGRMLYEY